MTEQKEEGGNCYHCGKAVDNDYYCYGCKEYICDGEDCNLPWSVADAIGRGHSPEDHKIDPDSAEGQEILGL